MRTFAIGTLAILLGAAWTVGPVLAADTSSSAQDKTATEKIKDTGATAKEKVRDTAETVKEKTAGAMETVKEKAQRAKAKLKEKIKGSTEPADVRAEQQALRDKGHDPGPIDGVLGPRTAAAVRSFQKDEGLKVTGKLDTATMDKLGISSPSASPSTETNTGTTSK